MSKKKKKKKRNRASKPRNIQCKQEKQQIEPLEETKKHSFQWLKNIRTIWKIVSVFAVLLTIFCSWYVFSPKLSATSSYSLNRSKPLYTKFDITNNSIFRINKIYIGCKNIHMKNLFGGEFKSYEDENVFILPEKPIIPYLEPGETTSVSLPILNLIHNENNFLRNIDYIDVILLVKYSPSFLPIDLENLFRFSTEKDSSGKLHWTKKSISEP